MTTKIQNQSSESATYRLERQHLSMIIGSDIYPIEKITTDGCCLSGIPNGLDPRAPHQTTGIFCHCPQPCPACCRARQMAFPKKFIPFETDLVLIARNMLGIGGFGFGELSKDQQNRLKSIATCEATFAELTLA